MGVKGHDWQLSHIPSVWELDTTAPSPHHSCSDMLGSPVFSVWLAASDMVTASGFYWFFVPVIGRLQRRSTWGLVHTNPQQHLQCACACTYALYVLHAKVTRRKITICRDKKLKKTALAFGLSDAEGGGVDKNLLSKVYVHVCESIFQFPEAVKRMKV